MGSMKDHYLGDKPFPESQRAYSRTTDPATSKDAAATVKVGDKASAVLDALRKYGPMTTFQIAERTGIDVITVSPRLKPLEVQNLIERAGTAPHNNRAVTLWKAKAV